MDYLIRGALTTDIPQMYQAHRSAIEISCAKSYSPEQIKGWVANIKPERYLSSMEKEVMLVVEVQGEVKGYGRMSPDTGKVSALYLTPSAQGAGLGKRLLESLLLVARSQGLSMVSLSASLNSAPFYRRLRWRELGAITETISNGTELECITFEKRLE